MALATDFDQDNDPNEDRVSLMTIHLAKGLEFPFVYIVGMEEDLFPSALSLNTRAELEEERRLFYVALTRAEERAFLSYTLSRYRWGKLIDAEPSRFLEEIDENYVEKDIPQETYTFKPLMDPGIFGEPRKSDSSVSHVPKPNVKINTRPSAQQLQKLKRIQSQPSSDVGTEAALHLNLQPGMRVEHSRFGKGMVENIEGNGNDQKASIAFEVEGTKKLLLRFAKLKILP